jgi:hypothetical protein
MFIEVLCTDKNNGYPDDYNLDGLIGAGLVAAFFRPNSNGWVIAETGR